MSVENSLREKTNLPVKTTLLNRFFPMAMESIASNFHESNMSRNYDLEQRLINYACKMMEIVEKLPKSRAGNHIAGQLIRSCTSPAFNYGEAQSAESRNDFIHKLRIVLKELKECRIALAIISKKEMIKDIGLLANESKETEELIAIIAKSIDTAVKNRQSLGNSLNQK